MREYYQKWLEQQVQKINEEQGTYIVVLRSLYDSVCRELAKN